MYFSVKSSACHDSVPVVTLKSRMISLGDKGLLKDGDLSLAPVGVGTSEPGL